VVLEEMTGKNILQAGNEGGKGAKPAARLFTAISTRKVVGSGKDHNEGGTNLDGDLDGRVLPDGWNP